MSDKTPQENVCGTESIEFEGIAYMWDGKGWVDPKTSMRPPERVVHGLNAYIASHLSKEDESITDFDKLLKQARFARDAHQCTRAELLVRRALEQQSDNVMARTILCSVLRRSKKPSVALRETDRYKNSNSAPLLTSRAAAYCDLGRWEDALAELNQACAVLGGDDLEATHVRLRIASRSA